MTSLVDKALNKLSSKERSKLAEILQLIEANNLVGLDVKRLKGHRDIYRVRKGKIRVIFSKDKQGAIFILFVERRSDNTYSI